MDLVIFITCIFHITYFHFVLRFVPASLLSLTVSSTLDMPKPSTSILVMQRYHVLSRPGLVACYVRCPLCYIEPAPFFAL